MQSTVNVLLEGESTKFAVSVLTENAKFYETIQPVTEQQTQFLGYTAKKVNLAQQKDGTVLVEFSNNLERFMNDQQLTLDEAMEALGEEYELIPQMISIVVDESAVDKLDLAAVSEKYELLRR